MAGNFEYYAELGLNAGAAISELSRVSSTADTVTKNLDAMGKALDQVSKKGLRQGDEKQLGETLKLYQQLAGAVSAYGRSLQTINSTDLNNGVRKTSTSLDHMHKALTNVGKKSVDNAEAVGKTLGLYKQLADASAKYASTMKLEADAIRAVASAEKTRAQTAASAANAATRGGTDMWGVSKEERDQRRMAQVVMQAEREMNAEFARREEAQRKARAEMEQAAKAEADKAAATDKAAAATKSATEADEAQIQALASTRYALYEVAAAYTATAAAALALPVASARVAIEMEAQFAHVARTTQAMAGPLENLRQQYMDISTEIPVTFEELSKIGTLGAQMGIASQDLESFADTVAKFSATTNVSVEEASTYFGRLANMMDDIDESKYRNLGAAVSELGTASVSTEREILAVAESIATTANMAGFTADEVVGLSTAMASLRIRPEMARGAMQRIFAKINQAVGEGNETLAEYASLLGVSTQAAAALWRDDPSQFFMGVNKALSEMDDNVERSIFLREQLQVTNIRDVELLARLSNGYDTYASSMSLAYDSYERGTYLEKEAGVIFETTSASLTKMANAFKALLDSFGESSLGPIKVVADLLTGLMNWVRGWNPAIKSAASGFAAFVGVVASFKAAMALATASLLAFQMIQRQLRPEGKVTFGTLFTQAGRTFPFIRTQADAASAALVRFRARMNDATGVMGKTAVAARGLGGALRSIGVGGWVGLAVTAASALWGIAQAHEAAAESARAHGEMLAEAMGGAAEITAALKRDAEELASGVQAEPIARLTTEVEAQTRAVQSSRTATTTYVHGFGEMEIGARRATSAIEEQTLAIGKHTDELIRQTLANYEPPGDIDMSAIAEAMERGFDPGIWLDRYYEGGVEAAEEYVRGFNRDNNAIQGWGDTQVKALEAYFSSAGEGLLQALISTEATAAVNNTIGEAFGLIEEGADAAAEEVGRLNEEFGGLVEGMFDFIDAEAAVYEGMQRLGESIDENGLSFDVATEAGRANMQAFQSYVEAMAKEIEQQVAAGAMSAEEGANEFANQYMVLLDQLAAMGVDTSEFDYFSEHINSLFSTPVQVGVDIQPAIDSLMALSEMAANVMGNIAANSGGLLGGMASWGQGVANRYRTRALPKLAQDKRTNRAVNAGIELQQRQRNEQAAARMQAIETARAAAEQKRLADEAERAAKEQKKAADETKKLREQIAEAKDEGRIFEEIIKGLGQAFKDTLHQFNNFQASRDSVEQRLINMRQAAQDAADKVRDLREEHAKLRREASEDRTDARQAESFAAVARQYGDTERAIDYSEQAEKARASAKEKDRLASEALKESRALDANRNSLTGYSEQAIKNRGDVRALQQEMTDLILAYAETGATTEEVTAFAEGLRRKFVDQLTQMGYNRDDVIKLSGVFIDLKGDIERIPREVRIKAEAEVAEAEAALREVARGRTATIDIVPRQNELGINGNIKANDIILGRQITSPSLEVGRVTDYGNGITSNWARRGGGLIPGPSNPRGRDNMLVVGPNGPEGTVGSGEFVIRKPAVDAIGLNALHALNSMSPGGAAMSSAPVVNASRTGIQLVEILPHQISQIAQAVSTVLDVDGKVLAGTTNAQNTNAARRGVK